jgi:hypothetical protein
VEEANVSLATLVEYAQTSFGVVSTSTTDETSELLTDAGQAVARTQLANPSPVRPPIPDWIRARRPEEEAPANSEHKWRIHGSIPPPLPPPDVDQVGADALAFYVPFHLYSRDWGIYIRDAGVKYLAFVLKGSALMPGDEGYLSMAELFLRHHEMWHAATEVACTRAELVARRSLYREYFVQAEASIHEEAIANAHAIRWTFDEDTVAERLNAEKWMRRQGPGYRDFAKWVSPTSFTRGQNVAARFMTDVLPPPAPKAAGAPQQFLYRGALDYPSMPVTRILEPSADDASVVRPFPREFGLQVFVYSNDHRPPHFHIKLLSNNDETRYLWPELKPYEGNLRLTGSNAKSFDKYWQTYKGPIIAKLRTVYPDHAG